ncbi:uncharacterized protein BDR25DRAFT_356783 [Lindgomyces ingoldianus]|uniref:Uncharacterized protein n=1 Tax=Lindgomyces ingoldianus TaxID=673940 RepID=A0ACB6QPU0_9PLEO|nr:uncharacterized protein BDR25DRAFT_356783 [Lindgomyces ingoldianus]KAF2469018.1 hypothetical protein BDR25DRAFT_356783 [Lindgomyces ingoldianus]
MLCPDTISIYNLEIETVMLGRFTSPPGSAWPRLSHRDSFPILNDSRTGSRAITLYHKLSSLRNAVEKLLKKRVPRKPVFRYLETLKIEPLSWSQVVDVGLDFEWALDLMCDHLSGLEYRPSLRPRDPQMPAEKTTNNLNLLSGHVLAPSPVSSRQTGTTIGPTWVKPRRLARMAMDLRDVSLSILRLGSHGFSGGALPPEILDCTFSCLDPEKLFPLICGTKHSKEDIVGVETSHSIHMGLTVSRALSPMEATAVRDRRSIGTRNAEAQLICRLHNKKCIVINGNETSSIPPSTGIISTPAYALYDYSSLHMSDSANRKRNETASMLWLRSLSLPLGV